MTETIAMLVAVAAAVLSTVSLGVSIAQYRRFVVEPQRPSYPRITPLASTIPFDEWPEQAPEIASLGAYGVAHTLGHDGRHHLRLGEGGPGSAAPRYVDAWTTLRSGVQSTGGGTVRWPGQ